MFRFLGVLILAVAVIMTAACSAIETGGYTVGIGQKEVAYNPSRGYQAVQSPGVTAATLANSASYCYDENSFWERTERLAASPPDVWISIMANNFCESVTYFYGQAEDTVLTANEWVCQQLE